jgi:hypothetical protein
MTTSSWNLRGASTNEYIVNPLLKKQVYFGSEFATLFGRINNFREVTVTAIERGDEKLQIAGSGIDSPVWEQDFNDQTGECRFTMVEPMAGLSTYGMYDPEVGTFDSFKHEVIHVVQEDSPVQPLLDKESQFRQSEVIPIASCIENKKSQMKLWREKTLEAQGAFRALFDGYSRGLLHTGKGGMALVLPGATAGQNRSCYNTVVANAFAFTSPNFTRATHEGTLATAIAALDDHAIYNFDYEQHKYMSYAVSAKKFKPVSIGGSTYRAFAIADPLALARLGTYGGTLETMLRQANERAMQNPILKGLQAWELDDILYVASKYMEYFRPTAVGTSTVDYLGIDDDPLSDSFSNTSKNIAVMYLGAGALCRGRRKNVWFTVSGEGASNAGHSKGTTYCLHYYDGWKRTEWVTKDGTSAIKNDASIMWVGYDPGVGKSPAA